MKECVFCRIVAGQLPSHSIWNDEAHSAFLDINPLNPGHTLLVPNQHTDYIFDLSEESLGSLFSRAKLISEPLRTATNAKRIGIVVEGFAVPHVHVHLVPIHTGNELDPNRAKPADNMELQEMAKKIRKEFESL